MRISLDEEMSRKRERKSLQKEREREERGWEEFSSEDEDLLSLLHNK